VNHAICDVEYAVPVGARAHTLLAFEGTLERADVSIADNVCYLADLHTGVDKQILGIVDSDALHISSEREADLAMEEFAEMAGVEFCEFRRALKSPLFGDSLANLCAHKAYASM